MKVKLVPHKLGTVHLGDDSLIDEGAVLGYLSPACAA